MSQRDRRFGPACLAASLGALAKPAALSLALLALVVGCRSGVPGDAGSAGPQAAQTASAQDSTPAGQAPLTLLGRTDLPDYTGDFDHFAADVGGNRLFLAGEDGGTLEVFALDTGEHLKTVEGFETPHAIVLLPEQNRLVVSDSGDSMTKLLDAGSYEVVGKIYLLPGADVLRHDPSTNRLWAVTGGKNAAKKLPDSTVSEIDAATFKPLGDIKFDTDFVEGIAFEQNGNRAFINVAGKSEVAVVDKATRTVAATWPVKEGQNNAPIALDEPGHRLFVVTRKPFKLVVLNTDTGDSVASFDAPQRTNDIAWDAANRRLYLTGDDHIAAFEQHDADHYSQIALVPSAKGAKTSLLVPDNNTLYVAVSPGENGKGGAVLRYQVAANAQGAATKP
jgi:hypothetical protein